jgi:hypothetical protein
MGTSSSPEGDGANQVDEAAGVFMDVREACKPISNDFFILTWQPHFNWQAHFAHRRRKKGQPLISRPPNPSSAATTVAQFFHFDR